MAAEQAAGQTKIFVDSSLGGLPHFLTPFPLAKRNETLHNLRDILLLFMRPYPHPTVSCIYRNLAHSILVLEAVLNFLKTSRADFHRSCNVRCVKHVNSPKRLRVQYGDLAVSWASVELWLYLEISFITESESWKIQLKWRATTIVSYTAKRKNFVVNCLA